MTEIRRTAGSYSWSGTHWHIMQDETTGSAFWSVFTEDGDDLAEGGFYEVDLPTAVQQVQEELRARGLPGSPGKAIEGISPMSNYDPYSRTAGKDWGEDLVGKQLLGFPGSVITAVEPTIGYLMNGPVKGHYYDDAAGGLVSGDFNIEVLLEDGRTVTIQKSYDWYIKNKRGSGPVTASKTASPSIPTSWGPRTQTLVTERIERNRAMGLPNNDPSLPYDLGYLTDQDMYEIFGTHEDHVDGDPVDSWFFHNDPNQPLRTKIYERRAAWDDRSWPGAQGDALDNDSKCENCLLGNHNGTNGTPGCRGGSCTCRCRRIDQSENTFARGSARTAAKVDVSQVGIHDRDGNILSGVDSSGNRVLFRVTPSEMQQVADILYSDLAQNFSGVTIDSGDIISEGRRRTADAHGPSLRGKYGPVGYDYQSDSYHPSDLIEVLIRQGHLSPAARSMNPEDALDQLADSMGIDRNDERSFDSGEFPKVILYHDWDEEQDPTYHRTASHRGSAKDRFRRRVESRRAAKIRSLAYTNEYGVRENDIRVGQNVWIGGDEEATVIGVGFGPVASMGFDLPGDLRRSWPGNTPIAVRYPDGHESWTILDVVSTKAYNPSFASLKRVAMQQVPGVFDTLQEAANHAHAIGLSDTWQQSVLLQVELTSGEARVIEMPPQQFGPVYVDKGPLSDW